MTQYIREIKKQFRDKYGFKPSRVVEGEPCFDAIPDGEYPMKIDGKLDYVRVKDGGISCCNDKSEKHPNSELNKPGSHNNHADPSLPPMHECPLCKCWHGGEPGACFKCETASRDL